MPICSVRRCFGSSEQTHDCPCAFCSPSLTDWASSQKGAPIAQESPDWPGSHREAEGRRMVWRDISRRMTLLWPGGFRQPGGRWVARRALSSYEIDEWPRGRQAAKRATMKVRRHRVARGVTSIQEGAKWPIGIRTYGSNIGQ